jgi:hypothetical protein
VPCPAHTGPQGPKYRQQTSLINTPTQWREDFSIKPSTAKDKKVN